MEADFKVVVITPESIVADEAARIEMLLRSGAVWRVHLRHPHASIEQIDVILADISEELRSRISLHDCYALAKKYKGVGVHLNNRNAKPQSVCGLMSKSCHTIEEVSASRCDYVTLSPIFDSISKTGYKSAFNLDDANLRQVIAMKQVIALGGVRPEYFGKLKECGFSGAALLGYVWQDDIDEFKERISKIRQHVCCNL